MWRAWGIGPERRGVLVRDGAANMVLGGNLAAVTAVHCTIQQAAARHPGRPVQAVSSPEHDPQVQEAGDLLPPLTQAHSAV